MSWQDIRQGFFGGLDLTVEKFFMAVFYNFPRWPKRLRKTKKREGIVHEKIILRRLPIWYLLGAVHILRNTGLGGGGGGVFIPVCYNIIQLWMYKVDEFIFFMWIFDNVFL